MSTLTQNTIVDRIEALASGVVQVRLKKQVLKDGEALTGTYHRLALEPGADTDAALAALNTVLTDGGDAAVAADDWAPVQSVCAALWTDTLLAACKAAQAAQSA